MPHQTHKLITFLATPVENVGFSDELVSALKRQQMDFIGQILVNDTHEEGVRNWAHSPELQSGLLEFLEKNNLSFDTIQRLVHSHRCVLPDDFYSADTSEFFAEELGRLIGIYPATLASTVRVPKDLAEQFEEDELRRETQTASDRALELYIQFKIAKRWGEPERHASPLSFTRDSTVDVPVDLPVGRYTVQPDDRETVGLDARGLENALTTLDFWNFMGAHIYSALAQNRRDEYARRVSELNERYPNPAMGPNG